MTHLFGAHLKVWGAFSQLLSTGLPLFLPPGPFFLLFLHSFCLSFLLNSDSGMVVFNITLRYAIFYPSLPGGYKYFSQYLLGGRMFSLLWLSYCPSSRKWQSDRIPSNHDCWGVSENEKSWVDKGKAGHLRAEWVFDTHKVDTPVVLVWGEKQVPQRADLVSPCGLKLGNCWFIIILIYKKKSEQSLGHYQIKQIIYFSGSLNRVGIPSSLSLGRFWYNVQWTMEK